MNVMMMQINVLVFDLTSYYGQITTDNLSGITIKFYESALDLTTTPILVDPASLITNESQHIQTH